MMSNNGYWIKQNLEHQFAGSSTYTISKVFPPSRPEMIIFVMEGGYEHAFQYVTELKIRMSAQTEKIVGFEIKSNEQLPFVVLSVEKIVAIRQHVRRI